MPAHSHIVAQSGAREPTATLRRRTTTADRSSARGLNVDQLAREMQQGGRRSNPQSLVEDLVDLLLDHTERSIRQEILLMFGSSRS
jgi:hypothetical protein